MKSQLLEYVLEQLRSANPIEDKLQLCRAVLRTDSVGVELGTDPEFSAWALANFDTVETWHKTTHNC